MRDHTVSGLVLALAALMAIGCTTPSSDVPAASAPAPTAAAPTAATPTAAAPTAAAPAGSGTARRPKGANEKLTAADCDAIFEHLVDVTLNEEVASDPDMKKAGPEMRELMRQAARSEMLKDPEMKKIAKDCRTDMRGKEYECIMKTKTTKAIDKCM
jgi:hypothetical protein